MIKKLLSIIAIMAFSAAAFSQTLDPTFGNGGKVVTHLGDGAYSTITDVKFLADGKILVCGESKVEYLNKSVVARYLSDGTLDPDFGSNGIAIYDIGTSNGSASSLLMLPDGKFLVSGENTIDYWGGESLYDSVILRCNEDGSLDSTFGVNGMVTTDASGFTAKDASYNLTFDEQGRILLAGEAAHHGGGSSYSWEDFEVVRYNNDGTIDNTFADAGIFKCEIGDNAGVLTGSVDIAYQVKTQADGKIVVCGVSDATSPIEGYNFAMVRLNGDGTLDQGFGTQGKVLLDLGGIEDFRSFHILDDGKYLAVGSSVNENLGSVKLVRLNSNGTPDATFGVGGIAEISFDTAGNAGVLFDSYLLPDGKIVAAGFKIGDTDFNDIVMRFNADGTPDESFGTSGRVEYDFMNGNDYVSSIDVDASGNLVVAGGSRNGSSEYNDFSLAKFTSQNLGISQEKASHILVSPNPFSSRVNVDGFASGSELSVMLYDMSGRKIIDKKQSSDSVDMPLNLPKGIYMLQVTDGKAVSVQKVVKE